MNNNKSNFHETIYSNLAVRRDYSKFDINFDEPNLLEIQKNSYNKFIDKEIKELVETYFPVTHPKSKYEIQYHGLKFLEPNDEQKARKEGKSYERPLYLDLWLVNHETGEINKCRKGKTGVSDGLFFANIPVMTTKGTFVINGIEKFVISQIVRSPGVYVRNKTDIKLNNKKKVNNGMILEILPSRGTLMNFIVDPKTATVKCMMRNSIGDNAPTFPATLLLKSFGMSQDEILNIFRNDEYIINTIVSETHHSGEHIYGYNHQNILEHPDILALMKTIDDQERLHRDTFKGLPIELKLRDALKDYMAQKRSYDELKNKYDQLYSEYEASGNEKKHIDQIESLIERMNKQEQKMRQSLDVIIIEKSSKDVVMLLGVSIKNIEAHAKSKADICYQNVLCNHFMNERVYDLTSAGRYKTERKLRISERLFNRVLASDVLLKNGKTLLKKNTFVNRDVLNQFKEATIKGELANIEFSLKNENALLKKQLHTLQVVDVYTSNDTLEFSTPIIGPADDANTKALTIGDFISSISYAINLPNDIGTYDDIDHLGNKRLRLIHEQLRNKLVAGMARVEKHIKEKLSSISIPTANEEQKAKIAARTTVKSVVNTKPFQLVIKNFFNSYQLTQFIDQQNPLSELTNKRRISAMGDGGISREDPNLDIRDIHYSHYGKICPIETPEGMNIGLILSLASFAKVDEHGFLITPYKKVVDGVVQDKNIEWMTALKEDVYVIGESTVSRDEKGKILDKKVIARYRGNQELYDANQIDYIDIAPKQVVSIAASCIPFLENDDTTRALMGANMQRQAVPLIAPYAPIIGTGSEYKIAHDSGVTVISEVDGEVTTADANKIVITDKSDKKHTYKLTKFKKSNQDTCINQTPIVEIGQKVHEGNTLADGPAMQNGELALGRNPLIAYMTWNGYNYEDAIIISDRLVKDDVYTSISIQELTIECLETKNGDEEITRELPNVSEESKRFLDENGVVTVGAEVKEGDILVGKITPKAQTEATGEEKLLQVLFGNKSKNFRDASLRVPTGGEGIVYRVDHFKKRDGAELNDDATELVKIFIAQKRKLQVGDKMSGRHGNKGIVSIIVPMADMPHMEDGTPIDICLNPLGVPSRMNIGQVLEVHLGLAMRKIARDKLVSFVIDKTPINEISKEFGLIKSKTESLIKIARKYFKDTDVSTIEQVKKKINDADIQIILRLAGLSVEDLGIKAATPVFMGAKLGDVNKALHEANINPEKTKGKFKLIDGRSGDYFDGDITVGVMYMLKLDHMVDDKIHARSIGPYSKVTQQPLGGRSQNGGQRFGEMEVWALEAYGAAYNLRELLTIKSDDVKGRNLAYSAIVKGKQMPQTSLPESFRLLTKQLQGLGLGITVETEDGQQDDINNYTSIISEKEADEVGLNENKQETITIVTDEDESELDQF